MSNGWVSGFRGLARTSRFLPRRRFALDFGRNDRARWLGLRESDGECRDPFGYAQGRLFDSAQDDNFSGSDMRVVERKAGEGARSTYAIQY
jgi:hypothetical protein